MSSLQKAILAVTVIFPVKGSERIRAVSEWRVIQELDFGRIIGDA